MPPASGRVCRGPPSGAERGEMDRGCPRQWPRGGPQPSLRGGPLGHPTASGARVDRGLGAALKAIASGNSTTPRLACTRRGDRKARDSGHDARSNALRCRRRALHRSHGSGDSRGGIPPSVSAREPRIPDRPTSRKKGGNDAQGLLASPWSRASRSDSEQIGGEVRLLALPHRPTPTRAQRPARTRRGQGRSGLLLARTAVHSRTGWR